MGQIDPAHMTIEQAARYCGISFAHAWWMVTTGRWNTVRVGAGNRIVRVWREQVEQSKSVWRDADLKAKARYREMSNKARKARANAKRVTV